MWLFVVVILLHQAVFESCRYSSNPNTKTTASINK